MRYRVEISPAVHGQIDEQVAYLGSEQVAEATVVGWLASLYDALMSLQDHPRRFPADVIRTRILGYEIRRMGVGAFVVYYRVDGDRSVVEVLAIRHGKRRPWLDGGAD
jgi:plasmid stabilization system protein ParE